MKAPTPKERALLALIMTPTFIGAAALPRKWQDGFPEPGSPGPWLDGNLLRRWVSALQGTTLMRMTTRNVGPMLGALVRKRYIETAVDPRRCFRQGSQPRIVRETALARQAAVAFDIGPQPICANFDDAMYEPMRDRPGFAFHDECRYIDGTCEQLHRHKRPMERLSKRSDKPHGTDAAPQPKPVPTLTEMMRAVQEQGPPLMGIAPNQEIVIRISIQTQGENR